MSDDERPFRALTEGAPANKRAMLEIMLENQARWERENPDADGAEVLELWRKLEGTPVWNEAIKFLKESGILPADYEDGET